jgi:hypothetical protein
MSGIPTHRIAQQAGTNPQPHALLHVTPPLIAFPPVSGHFSKVLIFSKI